MASSSSRRLNAGRSRLIPSPRQVIESVLGPIHLRLLLTGEPIDGAFLEGIVDVVVDGIARPRQTRIDLSAVRLRLRHIRA
jgi:hypothetical protein